MNAIEGQVRVAAYKNGVDTGIWHVRDTAQEARSAARKSVIEAYGIAEARNFSYITTRVEK